MALLGDIETRTGNSGISKFAEDAGFITRVPLIGGVARWLANLTGYIGAGWEGIGLLIQGKPLSALTAVTAGVVATTVDAATKVPIIGDVITWGGMFLSPLTGVTTNRSLGGLARKGVEEAIGGVTGLVGVKPTILRSYPAGIGSIGGGMVSGPGQFASAEAARRGQDPQAYYNTKMNGDMRQHVAELDSARSQPNYAGLGA